MLYKYNLPLNVYYASFVTYLFRCSVRSIACTRALNGVYCGFPCNYCCCRCHGDSVSSLRRSTRQNHASGACNL